MQNNFMRIQDCLPHRYPFLLVDRVLTIDVDTAEGAYIRALKNVTINEDFFNGHFPDHPIMPGVLTLEAMAQAAGLLAVNMAGGPNPNIIYYFAAADKVRFKRPIVPGDQLHLEARFINKKRGIWKFACQVIVKDEIVCSAEITSAERVLEQV